MASYQERGNIWEFIEVFEGVIKIQKVNKSVDVTSYTFAEWESWDFIHISGSNNGL